MPLANQKSASDALEYADGDSLGTSHYECGRLFRRGLAQMLASNVSKYADGFSLGISRYKCGRLFMRGFALNLLQCWKAQRVGLAGSLSSLAYAGLTIIRRAAVQL